MIWEYQANKLKMHFLKGSPMISPGKTKKLDQDTL